VIPTVSGGLGRREWPSGVAVGVASETGGAAGSKRENLGRGVAATPRDLSRPHSNSKHTPHPSTDICSAVQARTRHRSFPESQD